MGVPGYLSRLDILMLYADVSPAHPAGLPGDGQGNLGG